MYIHTHVQISSSSSIDAEQRQTNKKKREKVKQFNVSWMKIGEIFGLRRRRRPPPQPRGIDQGEGEVSNNSSETNDYIDTAKKDTRLTVK